MATFIYTAKKDTAETVSGKINASSQDEAVDLISQLGLHPVTLQAQEEDVGEDLSEVGRKQKVRTKELYVFSRQLANLLKSGITLLRALSIIEEQTHNAYFKKVISHINSNVKNGRSFSESLTVFPHIFSTLYITMVNAGEESGNLQEMLVNIAIYQRKQEEVRSKVKTAMVYPALMATVGIGTIYFVLTFVLPKMAGLYDSIGDSLPLPTVILLNVSQILNKGWLIVLVGICLLTLSVKQWVQSEHGKVAASRFVLHMPLFGEIILRAELSRFCRTLVLLLKSGVSIIKALDITIPLLSNELIKKHFEKCNDELIAGGSFGESIKESKEIPAMFGYLIAVGEESGSLNEVLADISDSYEQETDEKIKIMTTLLEPIMILVIGLLVGFIVFAMLLPIFQVDMLVS